MVARKTNLSPTMVQTIFDEHVQIERKPLSEAICRMSSISQGKPKINIPALSSTLKMAWSLMSFLQEGKQT